MTIVEYLPMDGECLVLVFLPLYCIALVESTASSDLSCFVGFSLRNYRI